MYRTGQLIWLKNIDNLSGHQIKESRLCVVRNVYNKDTIDLRTLSTIYYDKTKSILVKNLEEAQFVLQNLFETKIRETGQYVIFEPDKDNTINFSFAFGNMISRKINLKEFEHTPLLDKNNNVVYVSDDKDLELSLKEAEAIAKDIIYYFKIIPKKNKGSKKKISNNSKVNVR